MPPKPELNGCDYLMLGFDRELRRHGYAGYSCQIILRLPAQIDRAALMERLRPFCEEYPLATARARGVLTPHWSCAPHPERLPSVRLHQDAPHLRTRLFNEPLDSRHGELVRFDLIETDNDGMDVVFTWAHPLMDAQSAELFLALLGQAAPADPKMTLVPPGRKRIPLKDRLQLSWKTLHHLDGFATAPPRCLGIRHPDAPAELRCEVVTFTAEETVRIRQHSVQSCGPVGDTQFHACAAAVELHQLHERLRSPSASYVFPIPVSLRPKGRPGALFGNQVTMLMYQFLPEHLDSIATAAATLKRQAIHVMRNNLLESGRTLSDLFRFLPLPVYMAILKQGLRGEICSLFFGDTANVHPSLTSFLGVPIADFIHVPSITPSPGVGLVFYYWRSTLRISVVHTPRVLNDSEAEAFRWGLRQRLLGS